MPPWAGAAVWRFAPGSPPAAFADPSGTGSGCKHELLARTAAVPTGDLIGTRSHGGGGPKVTISLAPADVEKGSAGFGLPIAIACLIAGGQFGTGKIDE